MTTVTRPALLSALRYLMQAAGITPEELLPAPIHAAATPVDPAPTDGVDIDAVHRRQPAAPALVANSTSPRTPQTRRKLSRQAERVIELADRPDGVSVHEVQDELTVNEPTAHRHCQRLADELHMLTRVKLPGQRQHRYFARPAAAAAYVEAHRAGAVSAEPKPEPARATLTEAEQKAIRIKLAKRAGAKAAPPPMGARTVRKPPGKPAVELLRQAGTASPPAPKPRAAAEPIITEATRVTIDRTKRPNARHEAGPALPADPRWPSFAATPLGTNPDTGRPWA